MHGNAYFINDAADRLGGDVKITDTPGNEATARVRMNPEAMSLWAMQYARHATVLSPQSLADTVAADIKEAVESYQ